MRCTLHQNPVIANADYPFKNRSINPIIWLKFEFAFQLKVTAAPNGLRCTK